MRYFLLFVFLTTLVACKTSKEMARQSFIGGEGGAGGKSTNGSNGADGKSGNNKAINIKL